MLNLFVNNKTRYLIITVLSLCSFVSILAGENYFIVLAPTFFFIIGFLSLSFVQFFSNTVVMSLIIGAPIALVLMVVGGLRIYLENTISKVVDDSTTILHVSLMMLGLMLIVFLPTSLVGYMCRRLVLYIKSKRVSG